LPKQKILSPRGLVEELPPASGSEITIFNASQKGLDKQSTCQIVKKFFPGDTQIFKKGVLKNLIENSSSIENMMYP
jgi:hypothetical protein